MREFARPLLALTLSALLAAGSLAAPNLVPGERPAPSQLRLQQQQEGAASQNGSQRVKVLLVSNSDRQQAIDEASSLSLDLPRAAASAAGAAADSNGTASGASGATGDSSTASAPTSADGTDAGASAAPAPAASNGYRQHSLAALTLGQRHPASGGNTSEDRGGGAPSRSSGPEERAREPALGRRPAHGHTAAARAEAAAAAASAAALNEVDMPRYKPSWLNVSSRYKINGSTIEEVQYMMPAEYYLRQAFDAPVLLKTKLGIIEGVRSIKFNKHLYTFLSVPYARPPVDELRFKAPQPIGRWEGILQATKWPPFCVQPSMTLASKSSPVHPLSQMMSEDCLYLNVWTPSLKFNRAHRRPVMVWIHGGAFQYGGISVDENDGSALALAGDVVVVAMNYRISAFGFLNANNKQNGPNNVGLLDQRAALEWVQQNIRQFGGDPQQVTLFGESAGGHSVGLHMISPGSQTLFRRAIMQSGVPISFLRSYDVNHDNKGAIASESISSLMMAKRLKCYEGAPAPGAAAAATTTTTTVASGEGPSSNVSTPAAAAAAAAATSSAGEGEPADSLASPDASADEEDAPILSDQTLECMRQKSSLEILKAMGVPGNAGFFPTGNDPRGFFPNGPIMDSFDPENLKVGPQKDYLIGTNTDEGTFMLHYGMPGLFPSRAPPKVSSIEALKGALQSEIQRMAREAEELARDKQKASQLSADARSASGMQDGGAQAHLYRPLLKTSTSVLENFMPRTTQLKVLENGTIVGNASIWTKESEFGKNVGSLITDIIFLCPARALARTLAESGRNVYFYLYAHRSSKTPYHEWIGVTHHDEVEFVFGRPLRLADVYSGKDIEMSQRLIKTWSYFAYTGQALEQFGVKWPKYSEEENEYMNLMPDEASVGQRYHDRVCNVYDTVISVHLQDT